MISMFSRKGLVLIHGSLSFEHSCYITAYSVYSFCTTKLTHSRNKNLYQSIPTYTKRSLKHRNHFGKFRMIGLVHKTSVPSFKLVQSELFTYKTTNIYLLTFIKYQIKNREELHSKYSKTNYKRAAKIPF